jgi:hypothetical protein
MIAKMREVGGEPLRLALTFLETVTAALAWWIGAGTAALIAVNEVQYDLTWCFPPRAFCFADAVIRGIINPRPILSAVGIAAASFLIVALTVWRRGLKRWVAEIGLELGEVSPGLCLLGAVPFAALVGWKSLIVWIYLVAAALSAALWGACYLYQPQIARERNRLRREQNRLRRARNRARRARWMLAAAHLLRWRG